MELITGSRGDVPGEGNGPIENHALTNKSLKRPNADSDDEEEKGAIAPPVNDIYRARQQKRIRWVPNTRQCSLWTLITVPCPSSDGFLASPSVDGFYCEGVWTQTHVLCVANWNVSPTCHLFCQSRGFWLIVVDFALHIIWVSFSFSIFFCVFEDFFFFFKQFYF